MAEKNKSLNMKAVRRLIGYTSEHKSKLIAIMIFSLIGNVLLLSAPMLIGRGVDSIIGVGDVDFERLLKIIFALAAVYILGAAMLWLCSALAVAISTKTVYTLRKDAFTALMKAPISCFDRSSHGDIISRLSNDSDTVTDGLTQLLVQFFSAIVTVAAGLGFMLYLSPVITIAVVAVTPLIFTVSKTVTKVSGKYYRTQQEILGELSGFTHEQLSGQRVVKAFGAEQASQRRFGEINARLYTQGQKAQLYSSFTNPTTRFVNYISYILVGLVGGISAIKLGLSIGDIASFLTYSSMFSRPFNELSALTSQLVAAIAAAERLFKLIDEPSEQPDSDAADDIASVSGEVEFDNISFSYNPDVSLIQGLSLKVKNGGTAAIVGPTGAGKTTMVNLLMRFYDVTDGNIRIDDVDIMSMRRRTLRHSFGMVLQDTWLFSGTIRDNIAYGKPGATLDEVKQAAKSANAHSFIKRLSHGYDTIIDENGENLSLGQRQLITIARAMLLNPPMLILDEATSSVDTLTEQKIQETFIRMMQGRTSFIIAHRLSTIRRADLIIVMNNGAVIEQGTHNELMRSGGFYADMYNSQFDEGEN